MEGLFDLTDLFELNKRAVQMEARAKWVNEIVISSVTMV
jgi:hypothetical protein